jgi:exodeoxyribonuclease-3
LGTVRIITYNVNSIGARLPRLLALLAEHQPDVVCLQETKSTPEAFPHAELNEAGYVAADHSGGRWEGVAVLARSELGVDDIVTGLPGEPNPGEARWVEASVDALRVASVYVPNGRAIGSDAFIDKLAFFDRMAQRVAQLAGGDAVVAGDMNVCPTDQDVWDPRATAGGTHVTAEERSGFHRLLEAGYVDTFRQAAPDEPGFTWWDYRAGHFHKGYGLRIDLLLATRSFGDHLTSARVDRDYRKPTKVRESKPSDHAPLIIDFD